MTTFLNALRAFGRGTRHLFALVRDDSDLRETYPEHYRPTGAEAATQGSVVMSLTGLGNG